MWNRLCWCSHTSVLGTLILAGSGGRRGWGSTSCTYSIQLLLPNSWGHHFIVTTRKQRRIQLRKSCGISEYGSWHINRVQAQHRAPGHSGLGVIRTPKHMWRPSSVFALEFLQTFFFFFFWDLIVVRHKTGKVQWEGCCYTQHVELLPDVVT